MSYYYAVNGQQTGPVTEEDLRNMVATGSLSPQTLVWREGMADWQPFSVALGGGIAAGSGGGVECVVCHQTFPADQTIRYGAVNVCAGCKPRFVQGLREGAVSTGPMEFAGVGSRFVAKLLDQVILGVVNGITNVVFVGSATGGPGTGPNTAVVLVGILNFAIGMTYQAWFLHWRGQTLGKMAMGIKVVTAEGQPLNWGKAIGRPFAEILSGCTIGIGYLMAFWDPERRALHDRLVGTRVIKVAK